MHAYLVLLLTFSLLLVGADAEADLCPGTIGLTAVVEAVKEQSGTPYIECLLNKGARVDASTFWGETGLQLAVKNNNVELAELLLKHGAKERGDPILLLAAKNGNTEVADVLINHGADIDGLSSMESTPLIWAIYNGHNPTALFLIEKGANIKAQDSTGSSPIIYASGKGDEQIVRTLLDRGVSIESQSHFGSTPLISAASGNQSAMVKLLIEKGAQVEAEDKTGMRAIHIAASQGNTGLVHTLMDSGASTDSPNLGHYTPLMLAISSNNTETAHALISRDCYLHGFNPFGASALVMSAFKNMSSVAIALLEKGVDYIDKPDKTGRTALMYAAYLGLDDLVIALISKGVDVNKKTTSNPLGMSSGMTALGVAVEFGRATTVSTLIDLGAKKHLALENGETLVHLAVGAKVISKEILTTLFALDVALDERTMKEGVTALMIVAEKDDLGVANLLMDQGATVDFTSLNGKTALMMVSSPEMTSLLVNRGAVVDAQDMEGRTALMIAIDKDNRDIVSSLISHGANINLQDRRGRAALMIAIDKKNTGVVSSLISHGANINLQDGRGRTALMIAIDEMNEDKKWLDAIINLTTLINKGADLDAQDEQGWTALMYACKVKWWQIFNSDEDFKAQIVSKLLDAGARTDIRSHKGEVALTIANTNNNNIFKFRSSRAARRIILKEKENDWTRHYYGPYCYLCDKFESALDLFLMSLLTFIILMAFGMMK